MQALKGRKLTPPLPYNLTLECQVYMYFSVQRLSSMKAGSNMLKHAKLWSRLQRNPSKIMELYNKTIKLQNAVATKPLD